MSETALQGRLDDCLNVLDDDPTQIKRYLDDGGIKGERRRTDCCPLAELLRSWVLSALPVDQHSKYLVTVGRSGYVLISRGGLRVAGGLLPAPAQEFLLQVDAGGHSDSIRPSTRVRPKRRLLRSRGSALVVGTSMGFARLRPPITEPTHDVRPPVPAQVD
jgi:hypothetical protein